MKKNIMLKSIPLSVPSLKGNELEYVSECVSTEWVSSAGKYVERFEQELSNYLGVSGAVAVSNGTAALHLALMIAGVKPDEEVFVPAITFIAPVNAIRYVGAHPVFIDCDEYMNISCESIEEYIKKNCAYKNKKLFDKTTGRFISAMIPVHIFGHPVDMQRLSLLAKEYGLKIIEDATESLGSYYVSGDHKGMKTGTIGDFGCYSFNGNKIITTGGGGMLVCKKSRDYEFARYLSTQAKDDAHKYIHHNVGYNYRLTNIQAALGCAQLEKLDSYIKIKRDNFKKYEKLLADIDRLTLIKEPPYAFSNYWFYSLMLAPSLVTKESMLKSLGEKKIEARPLWFLNHKQKPYKNEPRALIKRADYYHRRIINIPCSVGISRKDIEYVAAAIIEEVGHSADTKK